MANQKEVADFLGVTPRTVRNLQSDGVFVTPTSKNGYDLKVFTQAYISYLRELAKKKSVSGTEPEKESQEARKTRLVNDDKEITILLKKVKYNQELRKWGPIDLLEYALQQFSAIAKTEIDTWVPKMRRACPDIPLSSLKIVEKTGVKIKNELNNIDVPLESYVKGSEEFDQEWAQPIEIEDSDNG